MPRNPRNFSDAPYYHVMVQGIKKEYIFLDNDDKKTYLRLVRKYVNENNINLVAYCIMGTHAHFIIKTAKVTDLSRCMKQINITYAEYYNKKLNRVGYVFRDRFKSEEIFEKYYLHNCIKYIHMNPVKAKICDKQNEYEFSSYKNYINKNGMVTGQLLNEIFSTNEEYLQVMDNTDAKCKFVDEELEREEIIKAFKNYLNDKGITIDELYENLGLMSQTVRFMKSELNLKNKDIAYMLKTNEVKVCRILKQL